MSEYLISGCDWSRLDYTETDDVYKDHVSSEAEANSSADPQEIFVNYFRSYVSVPSDGLSAYNLGVYRTDITDKNGIDHHENTDEILRATQYIGVVPLLSRRTGDPATAGSDGKVPLIKISSRFGISPTEMLHEVLQGEDYYDNPRMLSAKTYNASEWKALAKKSSLFDDKGEKILFGVITGIGTVDLGSGSEDGNTLTESDDLGLIDDYGIFEIIDFVSKTKEVCKKSLKRQSQKVEENLTCKVKGRILINKQIKYNETRGQKQKVYCAYNKMSEDIKENQILKYALHICEKKSDIGESLGEDIRFCMTALAGVPLKKCTMSDFVGLKNNGAYKQYKEALIAAKRVLSRYGIAYHDTSAETSNEGEPGLKVQSHTVQPFFIDMNLLFEYYCRALFRKAIDEVNDDDNEVKYTLESTSAGNRKLLPESTKKGTKKVFMPTYTPDIVVNYHTESDKTEKVACVIDAKYSELEDQDSQRRRERTHQILFYMETLGCTFGGLMSPKKKKKEEQEEMQNIDTIDILINGREPAAQGPQLSYFSLPYEINKMAQEGETEKYKESIKELLCSIRVELNSRESERKRKDAENEILSQENELLVNIPKASIKEIKGQLDRLSLLCAENNDIYIERKKKSYLYTLIDPGKTRKVNKKTIQNIQNAINNLTEENKNE